MICQFCGRPIKAIESLKRQAGHVCYMRDKEQLKLDLQGNDDERDKTDGKTKENNTR